MLRRKQEASESSMHIQEPFESKLLPCSFRGCKSQGSKGFARCRPIILRENGANPVEDSILGLG